MTLGVDDLRALAAIAGGAAREAGRFIARTRPQMLEHKEGGQSYASRVVTEVDRHSEALILQALAPTLDRYGLGVLTEERDDDGTRLARDYFWCIDPLDGTLPFVESRPGYAVSIALVASDGVPHVGAVFDPVSDTLWCAARGLGISRDERPWVARAPGPTLSVFVDRSFASDPNHDRIVLGLEGIAQALGLRGPTIRTTAAAVMNACDALIEPPACYLKLPKPDPGGGSLWDFAATACLFHEAGAIASDIHGDPLDLNRAESTFMNHRGVLFATDEALARRIRGLAAGAG